MVVLRVVMWEIWLVEMLDLQMADKKVFLKVVMKVASLAVRKESC